MSGRVASLFLSLALIGAACSGGGDRPTLTEATLAIDVDVLGSVEERDAAALPTTTDVEVVPTTVAQTSSSTVSTTTTEPDDGPPPAPASVRCGPGAAEGELTLSWDVPDVEDDVLNYRAYVDAGDGRFVQRVNIAAADAGSGDDGRHSVVVPDVPAATAVNLAVTAFDSVGNESGWNPVDAWYGGAGGACNTGAPAAIGAATVGQGGAEGEITVTFSPSADDIASYDASVSQPGVEGQHRVGAVSADGGGVVMVISGIDVLAPFTLAITATDFHGNTSQPTTVSCASLPTNTTC